MKMATGSGKTTVMATSAKLADLSMTVEARDIEHAADIHKTLQAAGFKLKA